MVRIDEIQDGYYQYIRQYLPLYKILDEGNTEMKV